MKQTWRWFGPSDKVSLKNIIQAGATGVVTSLHHIATGNPWPITDVRERKQAIEDAGLVWSVVESIPVHNDIKTRSGDFKKWIEHYKESLRNVGAVGVDTVCYNFMPVVDWTRTNLDYQLPNASKALRFEMTDFAAYDVFVLERENAASDYAQDVLEAARARFSTMTESEIALLERNIIAGLPGSAESYDRNSLRKTIAEFIDIGIEGMRANLIHFLEEVIPVAEEAGVRLCVHPDDPPFSLFGLPRVLSTADDARIMLSAVPSKSNGLTLCAGSFGARADNDLIDMVREFGDKLYFVHLRNIKREADGSFYESEHLDGDNDMVGLIAALLDEEHRRKDLGQALEIPMRPDHGHTLGDEIGQTNVNPGYSFGGRLKGLAELRGVIHALESLRN